jgi:hypothetical protein
MNSLNRNKYNINSKNMFVRNPYQNISPQFSFNEHDGYKYLKDYHR